MIYLKLNIKTVTFDGKFINFFLAMIILGCEFKFDIQTNIRLKISLTV